MGIIFKKNLYKDSTNPIEKCYLCRELKNKKMRKNLLTYLVDRTHNLECYDVIFNGQRGDCQITFQPIDRGEPERSLTVDEWFATSNLPPNGTITHEDGWSITVVDGKYSTAELGDDVALPHHELLLGFELQTLMDAVGIDSEELQ